MGSLIYKLLEADIKETDLIRKFADFLRKVLQQTVRQKALQQRPLTETLPKIEMLDTAETPQRSSIATQTGSSSVDEASASYDVSERRLSISGSDYVETTYGDDDVLGAYEVSSPYLNKMRFLDEQYGIRRDGNTLMIGSAAVIDDEKGDIIIGGTRFRGTRGLWERLTRKTFNSDVITNSDRKT